jgi:hypothetical protein
MIARSRRTLPFRWLAGCDVFGTDRGLRSWLEQQGIPYVLAVPRSLRSLSEGDRATAARGMSEVLMSHSDPWYRPQNDKCTVELFAPEWARLPLPSAGGSAYPRSLLLRRERRSRSLACYVCVGPPEAGLPELASVAGAQAAADLAFQIARRWAGLDQYQVRSVEAWYRHVTLAMLAHTCLASAVLTAEAGNSPEAVSAM